jgi:hypothetical protein
MIIAPGLVLALDAVESPKCCGRVGFTALSAVIQPQPSVAQIGVSLARRPTP